MPGRLPQDRFEFSDQVVVRELAGESVLLDLRSGIYFGLNSVGTRAWELLASGASLEEVSTTIHEEFDAQAHVILEELLRFTDDLVAHDLCVVRRPQPPAAASSE